MNCPICLDPLRQSVIFSCTHACCSVCVRESKITACPLCRHPIESTTPSPWLDNSNDNDNSSNFNDNFSNFNSNDNFEDDGSKEDLCRIAAEVMENLLPVTTGVDRIMLNAQKKIDEAEDCYQQAIEEAEQQRNKTLKTINKETQKLLDMDSVSVKQQEYYNQGMEHLSYTCLALSTQPQHVLKQVLPLYEAKIREALNKRPSGMSLLTHSFEQPILSQAKLFTYVKPLNEFVYVLNNMLILGTKATFLSGINQIEYNYNLIYVSTGSKVIVYDLDLILVSVTDITHSSEEHCLAFYLHGSKIEPIKYSGTLLSLCFKGKEHCKHLDKHEKVINAKVLLGYGYEEQLFVSTSGHIYDLRSSKSGKISTSIASCTEGEIVNFIVSNGNMYVYRQTSDKTEITTRNGTICLPGNGTVYAGNNVAFYVHNSTSTVVNL